MTSILDCLDDIDELNRHMDADPQLARNMAEMGYIAKVPFQLNHNQYTVSKWAWTAYGRREMLERIEAGFQFAAEHGQEKLQ